MIGKLSNHQSGIIYGGGEFAPTLSRWDFKEPVKILITENEGNKMVDKIMWPNGSKGEIEAKEGDCVKILPHPFREHSAGNVREGCSNALNTKDGCGCGVVVKEVIPEVKGGIPDLKDGECKAFLTPGRAYKDNNGTRCKKDDIAFTVTKETDGIVQKEHGNLRIRYLTPRECLRLQAFPDDAIDRLQAVLSKSAMYKVAGNSIAVCCLKAIFKGIYVDKTFRKAKQCSLDDWF